MPDMIGENFTQAALAIIHAGFKLAPMQNHAGRNFCFSADRSTCGFDRNLTVACDPGGHGSSRFRDCAGSRSGNTHSGRLDDSVDRPTLSHTTRTTFYRRSIRAAKNPSQGCTPGSVRKYPSRNPLVRKASTDSPFTIPSRCSRSNSPRRSTFFHRILRVL